MKNINNDTTTHYVDQNANCGAGGIFAWQDTEVTNDVATYRAWHNDQLNATGTTWPLGTAPSYGDLLDMLAAKDYQLGIKGDVIRHMLMSDGNVAFYRDHYKAEQASYDLQIGDWGYRPSTVQDGDAPISLYPDRVNPLDTKPVDNTVGKAVDDATVKSLCVTIDVRELEAVTSTIATLRTEIQTRDRLLDDQCQTIGKLEDRLSKANEALRVSK